jgi:hypothetical protein
MKPELKSCQDRIIQFIGFCQVLFKMEVGERYNDRWLEEG